LIERERNNLLKEYRSDVHRPQYPHARWRQVPASVHQILTRTTYTAVRRAVVAYDSLP
jgi:hypothetical protein